VTALVVPTKGDRPYLPAMIEASGLPKSRIFVVVTTDAEVDYKATIIRDTGDVNIHRWWNKGIDAANRAGASHVAILNDDLIIPPNLLRDMSRQLGKTDASLCWVRSDNRTRDPITGWAFMLNTIHGIRPDESFRWWYGDDDLARQARRIGGVTQVGTRVRHMHPNELTTQSWALQLLANADKILYDKRKVAQCQS
jgi:hypothetical protein